MPDQTPEEKLAKKLKEIQQKSLEKNVEAKAQALGLPYINLHGFPISPEAIGLIPEEQARALKVICFLYTPNDLSLGAIDPNTDSAKELFYQLEERHHVKVKPYVISDDSFNLALKFYGTVPKIKPIKKGVSITAEEIKKY